jgi:tryptophan-rich sensory protein
MIQIFIPLVVGFLSFLISGDFSDAPRSSYQPPPIVFSLVWPVLYLLMGYSGYRVSKIRNEIPTIFYVQLFLNFTWSIVYTRIGPREALVNIILLLFAIFATTVTFYGIDKPSAGLLLPYLVWVCFATFLNADIVLAH